MSRIGWTSVLSLLTASWFGVAVQAADVYVDTHLGDDTFNGHAAELVNADTGPVRTLRRGLERVNSGDSLILVNRGELFHGEISMTGPRFCGVLGKTFTLEGNGVVLDGSQPIPPEAWVRAVGDLWKFTPIRKGSYLLLLEGKPVSEVACSTAATKIPDLAVGQWCAWRGSIYFRASGHPFALPRDLPLSYAVDGVGISLLDVQNVVIRNVKIRHYRQDGVNAHDRCRNVVLENVTLEANGRTGLAVGGNSLVGMRNCTVTGNRVAQVLVTERAQVELLKTKLGDGPGLPFQITGGHLLIDDKEVFPPKD